MNSTTAVLPALLSASRAALGSGWQRPKCATATPERSRKSSHVGAWEIIQTHLFILMLVRQMPSMLLGTNGLLSPQYSFFSLLNLRFLFYIKTSALWLFLLLSALQLLLKSDSTEHVLWDFQISRPVVNLTTAVRAVQNASNEDSHGQAG